MPAFVARNYRSTIADKTVCRYKHVTPNKDEVTGVDEIMRYSKNTLNLNREFNPSKLELNIEHDNNHKENGKKLRIRCYLCDNKTICKILKFGGSEVRIGLSLQNSRC